nr:hypothetical protein [Tanacetum cinerariifolium]
MLDLGLSQRYNTLRIVCLEANFRKVGITITTDMHYFPCTASPGVEIIQNHLNLLKSKDNNSYESVELVEDDKEDEVEDDKDQEEEEEDDNNEKEQDDNDGSDDETWIPKKKATSSSRRSKKKKFVKRGEQLSPTKPEQDLSHTNRPTTPIIEDWVSDFEDEYETKAPPIIPSFVQSTKQVKSPRHFVQHVETSIPAATHKPTSPKPASNCKRRNRKACFVCKSVDHLIKDCDYHEKQKAQPTTRNHAHRGNHKPVSAVVPQIKVNRPKQVQPIVTKPTSPIKRHITRSPSIKTSNSPPRVTGVKALVDNSQHTLKDKEVIDSGCSRHMTGNMSYLFDFEELNGRYVFFGGNQGVGIKREFSVPRTPQQNGIAERKNKTLIEAAKTMLADSLLPIPFWAEAFNTAFYVQIGYSLGKFNKKVDEGFLVGYSISSKAFRVFNSRTRIVQETLHVNFLENKPNVAGVEINQQYVLFPVWCFGFTNPQNTDGDVAFDGKKPNFDEKKPQSEVNVSPSSSAQSRKQDDKTKKEAKGKSPIESLTRYRDLNSTNTFSAAGPLNAAASPTYGKSSFIDAFQLPDAPHMPELEDITYSNDEDDVGTEADFNNFETSITVSPIPTSRVHRDHHVTQIIGDLSSTTQTRSMKKVVKDQGGLSQIFNDDFHTCMFACFLSQEEPKRVHQALKVPSWIEAMQEELLQFKIQKVWILVDLPTIEEEVYVCQPPGFEDPDHPIKYTKWSRHFMVSISKSLDKYVAEILRMFILQKGKSASTPIDTEKPLLKDPDSEGVDVHTYRLISWQCKKQTVVATSSTKDEYVATTSCCVEVLWIIDSESAAGLWVKENQEKDKIGSKSNKKQEACRSPEQSKAVPVNDVTRLQALVNKKKVVVTEATIREALHLDDAEGVDCLPNEEIFTELARMSYEKPSTKLTFYKAFFSSQWNLVRNVDSPTKFYMYPRFLQLMIRKQVGKGFFGVETPLFESMLVEQQVDKEGYADENVEEVNAGDAAEGDVSAAHGEVSTVVDYQIIKMNNKPYYKIIRVDDTHQLYRNVRKAIYTCVDLEESKNSTWSSKGQRMEAFGIMWCADHNIYIYPADFVSREEVTAHKIHSKPDAEFNGFQRGTIDQTLFIKKQKGDILLVKQKKVGIFISQDKYVAEILRKFGLTERKSASTPIDTEKPLLKDPDGEDVDAHTYRGIICSCSQLLCTSAIDSESTAGLWDNDVTKLQTLVDKKKVVVTEAAIREVLRLDDTEGVDCLSNEEILAELARMGYEKPSTKLKFYKAFFSRHLVRNVDNTFKFYMYPRFIQLLIKKQVGDLLTHTTKYASPALTQKVFANIRRVWKGFSRVETPLFEGMIVGQVIEEGRDAEEHVKDVTAGDAAQGDGTATHGEVPTVSQEPSIPSLTPPTPPPQPLQDLPSTYQVHHTPPQSPQEQQPSSQPQAQQQAAYFPMNPLQEALDACAALTKRVEHLELKRVGTSQRVDSSEDTVMDDASNQGRIIDELYMDDDVALMDDKEEDKKEEKVKVVKDDQVQGRQAESQAEIYKIDLDHASKVLSKQEDEPGEVQEVVDVVTTAKLITEVVTTANETVTAASTTISTAEPQVSATIISAAPAKAAAALSRRRKRVVIRDPEKESTTSSIIPADTKSKHKRKGIMAEDLKPLKKKQQDVAIDHVKQKAKDDPAVQRYQVMKKKPHTEAQAQKNMITYLKNVAGFRLDYFKGMSYDDIRPIFESKFNSNIEFLLKTKEQMEEEESRALQSINETSAQKAAKKRKLNEEVEDLKRHLEIMPDEDDDVYTEATLLARKVPVVDYEIITLNNKPYYKIIRAD